MSPEINTLFNDDKDDDDESACVDAYRARILCACNDRHFLLSLTCTNQNVIDLLCARRRSMFATFDGRVHICIYIYIYCMCLGIECGAVAG